MGDVEGLRGALAERTADTPAMLPALAYTSPEVLGWELRHVFAGTWTCLGRLDELLPVDGDVPGAGATSGHRSVVCPYHAWSYRLDGSLLAAPGFGKVDGFEPADHALVELPVEVWAGWVFGHGKHPLGDARVPSFDEHLGGLRAVVEPYQPERLAPAAWHTYEIAANWKVVAENYHECYHGRPTPTTS